jgi:hypothetical protein
MAFSPELTRFLADHATAESWADFSNGVATPPTAATLAAAITAKGYRVGEAEIGAALELAKQAALTDRQLDAVVGGGFSETFESLRDTHLGGSIPSSSGGPDNITPTSAAGPSLDLSQIQELMNQLAKMNEKSSSAAMSRGQR